MELSIQERLVLLQMLPNEGSWLDMVHIKGVGDQISISSEEASKVELKQEATEDNKFYFNWKREKEIAKPVELTPEQHSIILELFPKLQVATTAHVLLYEKIKSMSEQPIKCRTKKPPLPPTASPNAYWRCNEETGEWELIDEWVADSESDSNVDN